MRSGKKICLLTCGFILIVMCSCSFEKTSDIRPEVTQDDADPVITIEKDPVVEAGAPEENKSPEDDKEPEEITETKADGIDVDLTVLSGTMVYAEVYDMMYYPENYVGKTVKMEGLYATAYDASNGKRYHACIIQDATACCSQGIEFEPNGDLAYPDDFPLEGEDVCVTGTFETYTEGEQTYCTLRNACLL